MPAERMAFLIALYQSVLHPLLSCQVSALAAEATRAVFSTGGGHISLKRVVGLDLRVETAGGDFETQAMYADRASVDTGGGSASIGTVRVGISASLVTQTGNVDVGNVDGSLNIDTAGGEARIQLGEAAGDICVRTDGGHSSICLPAGVSEKKSSLSLLSSSYEPTHLALSCHPRFVQAGDGLALPSELLGGGGIHLGPGLEYSLHGRPAAFDPRATASTSEHLVPSPPESAAAPRAPGILFASTAAEGSLGDLSLPSGIVRQRMEVEKASRDSPSVLRVDAGSGSVDVRLRSWFEQIGEKKKWDLSAFGRPVRK